MTDKEKKKRWARTALIVLAGAAAFILMIILDKISALLARLITAEAILLYADFMMGRQEEEGRTQKPGRVIVKTATIVFSFASVVLACACVAPKGELYFDLSFIASMVFTLIGSFAIADLINMT